MRNNYAAHKGCPKFAEAKEVAKESATCKISYAQALSKVRERASGQHLKPPTHNQKITTQSPRCHTRTHAPSHIQPQPCTRSQSPAQQSSIETASPVTVTSVPAVQTVPTAATSSAATSARALFIPGPTTVLRPAPQSAKQQQQHTSTPIQPVGARRELFQAQHSPVTNDFRHQMISYLNHMTKVMVYYIHPKLHQDFLMDMYAGCNRIFGLNLNFCDPISERATHN